MVDRIDQRLGTRSTRILRLGDLIPLAGKLSREVIAVILCDTSLEVVTHVQRSSARLRYDSIETQRVEARGKHYLLAWSSAAGDGNAHPNVPHKH